MKLDESVQIDGAVCRYVSLKLKPICKDRFPLDDCENESTTSEFS